MEKKLLKEFFLLNQKLQECDKPMEEAMWKITMKEYL